MMTRTVRRLSFCATFGVVFALALLCNQVFASSATSEDTSGDSFMVSIYDRGEKKVVQTSSKNVEAVLEEYSITLESVDKVEPSFEEEINSNNFQINIYRAKPVVVVDGIVKTKILTSAQTPSEIVKEAGLELKEADTAEYELATNLIESGVNTELVITRAKTVKLSLYGKEISLRTQAATVGDLLEEKDVGLAEDDFVSLSLETRISEGLELKIWRNGKNLLVIEEDIPFEIEQTKDFDKNVGFREVVEAGEVGVRAVTYEVYMDDGVEISRKAVGKIIVSSPKTQREVIGAKSVSMKPLTSSMGRNRYTTSDGILREETYYDLDMSTVMKWFCGAGGYYSVRADGVKVDKDGYVIVAAHLGRYPRCSIVETSLGPGKVYDTGSFANSNAEQFDIATDWTKRDGI